LNIAVCIVNSSKPGKPNPRSPVLREPVFAEPISVSEEHIAHSDSSEFQENLAFKLLRLDSGIVIAFIAQNRLGKASTLPLAISPLSELRFGSILVPL